MRKIILLFLLIPLASHSQDKNLEKKFDSVLHSYVNHDKPGFTAGVISDGKILYLKGFGVEDIETRQRITTQTKFQADDLAKQFTVLSMLQLEQEGKLSFEDDVRKYLPNLPKYNYILKVKHLINHSSGLHNLDPVKELLGLRRNDIFTHEDAVKIISSQEKLNFKPGSQFSYHRSDTELILMVEIVKAVSKQSFIEYTKQHLFEALGMTNTFFHNDNSMFQNMAKSYLIEKKISYNPKRDFTLGVTNLYTTAEDFAKWFQTYHLNKNFSNLVKKLDTYVALDSGKEFASTWGKVTLGRYYDHPERGLPKMSWQFGLTGGYGANFFRYQSHKLVSFVLGNNNSYNGMPAMLLANQIMEKEYKEPEEIDYSKIKTKRLSLRNLKKLEGFYYDKTNSIVREIYVKNDTLRYKRVESNRETPMLALSNNKFQLYQRGDIEVFITFTNNTFEISSLNSDVSIYDKVNIVESSALRLSDYSGHYYNKELDVILKFSLEENALTTSSLRINPIRFYPIIKDSFRSNTFIFSGIQFTREDDIVSGFNINTDGVSNLYFEKIKWN